MAEVLVQSYSESNFTVNFSVHNGGFGNERIGAPFKGDGTAISRVVFYLSKTGSPTGNAHVRIYDLGVQEAPYYHDTVPGGSALAESDAVDVSTIAGSSSLIEFSFSGSNRILLTDDNYYAAILEYDDAGSSSSDRLNFGTDSTPADDTSVDRELYIIRYRDNEADWSSTVAYDPIYYIYGEEVETNTYYFDGHAAKTNEWTEWKYPTSLNAGAIGDPFTNPTESFTSDNTYATNSVSPVATYYSVANSNTASMSIPSTEDHTIVDITSSVADVDDLYSLLVGVDIDEGTIYSLWVDGFDFTEVPRGSTLNSVELRLEHYKSGGVYYVDSISVRVQYSHTGILDPDSVWTNEANAFDGSTSTFADTDSGGGNGSNTSKEISGIGTTAPSSGGSIVQVRSRVFGARGTTGSFSPDSATTEIFTSGGPSSGESLGSISTTESPPGWSGYTTLSEPTGGWSWSVIQSLESYSWNVGDAGISGASIRKVELEVTSVAPDTTTTAITKDLAYAVLTTPTTTQKSLAYFIRRDDLIQKSTTYTVTDTNLVQKTLAYLVAATPESITKSLGYMVRSTPSAVTKSVQYMVAATPAALTKALTYGVDIVASPSNIFSPAVGGFMVGQFWTASASSTLTEVITKTLEYAIGAGATISKSLAYVIAGSDTITKNVTYAVLSNALIQKSVAYTVQTSDSLTKTLQYIIKSSPTLTKGMTYVVLTANTIQKGLSYTILSAEAITKSLTYAVLHPATITKSIAYAIIKTPTAISKLLTYSVVGESAIIQKTVEYRLAIATSIQKSLGYAVQASQSITKSLTYYLTSTTYDITKALEYRVKPVGTITKSVVYTVLTTPSTLTKSLSYQVVTSDTIQKSLQYIIQSTTALEKSLEYRVLTNPSAMTKSLAYFIGRPISITKSLAYRIKNRYPKPPTMTVEAVQSRWLQVKNQKPPKTIVE